MWGSYRVYVWVARARFRRAMYNEELGSIWNLCKTVYSFNVLSDLLVRKIFWWRKGPERGQLKWESNRSSFLLGREMEGWDLQSQQEWRGEDDGRYMHLDFAGYGDWLLMRRRARNLGWLPAFALEPLVMVLPFPKRDSVRGNRMGEMWED